MLYLSFIWHMHQPYYKNLLTNEAELPWVRLHGIKDYADMVAILKDFPRIHQTFNVVPSLIEQINSYVDGSMSDAFMRLSRKRADTLPKKEKQFIIENFFMTDANRIIAQYPRYNELYLQKKGLKEFSCQDILDLQVWFNLAWFDPSYKSTIEELSALIQKGRSFSEEEKNLVLDKQIEVLASIIPTYREFQERGQIEVSVTPYYHPILPLLIDTGIATSANKNTALPRKGFQYSRDCLWHVQQAVQCYKDTFGSAPAGMWPSEQAISQHVIPFIVKNDFRWIVLDEALIVKYMKMKKQKKERAGIVYKAYTVKRRMRNLSIVFRDRNLSDLISFVYKDWDAQKAVSDFLSHLKAIHDYLEGNDCLVVVALDGENAWEYYPNDGRDFLAALYSRISESQFIKTVTVSEYLKMHSQADKIEKIPSGSWINGDFLKWIGHPVKNKAWELLGEARKLLDSIDRPPALAWKQIYILEGSDWFWWYGEKQKQFDALFRLHLRNFYKILGKKPLSNLDQPIE